jgi:hypothetical protein
MNEVSVGDITYIPRWRIFCGVRLVEEREEPPEPSNRRVRVVRREDGRPWIDAEGSWEQMGRYRE